MKALFLSKNCQLHKLKINFGEEHAQIRKVLPHEGTFHFEVEEKKNHICKGGIPLFIEIAKNMFIKIVKL